MRPARGCLGKTSPSTHREHLTLALPPGSTHEAQAPEVAQQAQARRGTFSEVFGGSEHRGGKPPRSPRRGSFRSFQLEELVEEVEATILSKHRLRGPSKLAGVTGRRWRRFRYRQRARGEREESEGAGLGRLTDPDPSRFSLTEPGGPLGSNGPRPIC
jgi:hypothetical protein